MVKAPVRESKVVRIGEKIVLEYSVKVEDIDTSSKKVSGQFGLV